MNDTYAFLIKPIGVEANQRLCELLDVRVTEAESDRLYEVSAEEFVFVYQSNRTSGLQFQFLVKFNDEINPVQFVPDHQLDSVCALQAVTDEMLEKLRPIRHQTYSGPSGVMPWNALPPRFPRKIVATRANKK